MKKILAVVPAALLLAACTSTGTSGTALGYSSSPEYWRGPTSSVEGFRHDDVVCSARAAKFGNVDMKMAPDNRIDRPMQQWPNAVAQETYVNCMRDVGWRSLG